MIFGELGNDCIQGDGSVDSTTPARSPSTLRPHAESVRGLCRPPARDGDDYIEGSGGNDVIFGNLGQDDLIGGSSTCSA